jgi:NAD(P)-dependent dehydrogenase (short-subunit alcohol dehydrogenase family)
METTHKVCVITGANSGIGYETTKALAAMGMFVVMVCRNEGKALAARNQLVRETANSGIEVVICDFAIQHDIREAARAINEKFDKIDILINNHGSVAAKREETIDGIEKTFAVNHLGYFLFTNLLLDKIKAADAGRIINVASNAHKGAKFDPENLQQEQSFSSLNAYSVSKLCNILFTMELAERLKGTNVTANSLHPGFVDTGIVDESNILVKSLWLMGKPFAKNPRQGARTSVYLATSPDVKNISGEYFNNRKITRPSMEARNMDHAKTLWEISEELTGLSS